MSVRYYFLLLLIALASFFVAASLSALAIHLAWPRIKVAAARLNPRIRARALLVLRALPAFWGIIAAGVFGRTFLAFEPEKTSEYPGLLLAIGAFGALWLSFHVGARGARALVRTLTLTRLMRACGQDEICVVDSFYPVAAVAGLFRMRVVLSQRILQECEQDEIEAILAHEAAHVHRGDNLARAVMLSLPDLLTVLPTGRAIESAWSAAAEEASDDAAAGGAADKRAALASALVRVAGMATTAPPRWMPALAFFQGDDLDRRVRRLLEPEPACGPSLCALEPLLIAAAVLAVAVCASQGAALHGFMEWAIRSLP